MLPVLSRDFEPTNYGFWRPLIRQLDDMFDLASASALDLREHGRNELVPPYDIEESEEQYLLNFDVPGVHRDDLNIEVTGNRLSISGERKSESSMQKRFGKFHRIFALPDGIKSEDVAAEYRDGVLRLAIQKPASVRPTKIKISGDSGSKGFLKNLIGEKKSKDAVDIKSTAANKNEAASMAN